MNNLRLSKNEGREDVRKFIRERLNQKRSLVSLSKINEDGKESNNNSPNKVDSRKIRGFNLKRKFKAPILNSDSSQQSQFKTGILISLPEFRIKNKADGVFASTNKKYPKL